MAEEPKEVRKVRGAWLLMIPGFCMIAGALTGGLISAGENDWPHNGVFVGAGIGLPLGILLMGVIGRYVGKD